MNETRITLNNDGSIKVEGDFTIYDSQGRPFDLAGRRAISLCRCGHSENKPFCDGSHKRVGFRSEVVARTLPPPAPKPVTG
jgi:CDGSH-type Zn-finger protein